MNKSNKNTAECGKYDTVSTKCVKIDTAQTALKQNWKTPETPEQVEALAQTLPFDNLTSCRRRLIVVNYDPELVLMTVTDKCALAGVGRRTYYGALQDPEYLAACKEMTRLAWAAMQPEMQGRYAELARSTKPGADRAIERILEQGESLREKAGPSVNVSVTMTAEQLAEKRHKNQAEGLRLLGLPVPEFLQIEGGNGNDGDQGGKPDTNYRLSPNTGVDDHRLNKESGDSGRITAPEPATTCHNSNPVSAIKEDSPETPDSGLDQEPNRPQIDAKQPSNSPIPATKGKPDDDF